MTDRDNRYGDAPLGRSVEQIEGDVGNRVNPAVPGEQVRDEEMLEGVPIPPVLSGPSGTAMIPATPDGGRVTEGDGGTAADGTGRTTRDDGGTV